MPTFYAYYVPTVVVQFADGSSSMPATSPYPIVNVPEVTPQTLASLYSIPPSTVATNATLTQCVGEFEQQYYSPSDLDTFLRGFGLPDAPVNVIGPNDASNPGGEASLDIQYIMGSTSASAT